MVGWEKLVKYEKFFTERVCVENARSEKRTGKREGDGWHGLGDTKRVSGRGKKGLGGGRKRGVISVQSENRKGNCGDGMRVQEKRGGGRLEHNKEVNGEKRKGVGINRRRLERMYWSTRRRGLGRGKGSVQKKIETQRNRPGR